MRCPPDPPIQPHVVPGPSSRHEAAPGIVTLAVLLASLAPVLAQPPSSKRLSVIWWKRYNQIAAVVKPVEWVIARLRRVASPLGCPRLVVLLTVFEGIILTYTGLRAAGLRPAPYAGVALSADGARTWCVGSRLSVDPGLSVDLEGTRGEPPPTGRSTPSRYTGGTEPFVQCRTAGTSRAGTPAAYPHYCLLLDEPLTEQGKNEICREQQPAA